MAEIQDEIPHQVTVCRNNWEPFMEDSIGCIVGGYRAHDEHCVRCKPILALLKRLAAKDAQIAELQRELEEARKQIASCDQRILNQRSEIHNQAHELEMARGRLTNFDRWKQECEEWKNPEAAFRKISELTKRAEAAEKALAVAQVNLKLWMDEHTATTKVLAERNARVKELEEQQERWQPQRSENYCRLMQLESRLAELVRAAEPFVHPDRKQSVRLSVTEQEYHALASAVQKARGGTEA